MSIALQNESSPQDRPSLKQYRLNVLLAKEQAGDFSAIALDLPGVVGCGDTEEEAIESLKEGFLLSIEVYAEDGEEIPWSRVSAKDLPDGQVKLIHINA